MTPKKILAIIPARGGSQGITKKNIIPICGKPLIAWTIESAKKCPLINKVVVSSDDDEIISIAKKYGAETFKRPSILSTDNATPESVLLHALSEAIKHGFYPDVLMYLQPTSPIRNNEHLEEALKIYFDRNADQLISVVRTDSKVLKSFFETPDKFLVGISNNDYPFMNRQSLPPVYISNGAIYILNTKSFSKQPRFWSERTVPYIMSQEESFDIDTPDDVLIVDKILKARIPKK